MDKSNLIQSLQNVKIIIGNGADLYCLLPTKYKDFFGSKEQQDIQGLYAKFKQNFEEHPNVNWAALRKSRNYDQFYFIEKRLTAWHVLFYMESPTNGKKDTQWCDIEACMHDSFLRQDHLDKESLSWDSVCSILSVNGSGGEHNEKAMEMAWFLFNKRQAFFRSSNDFYDFLMEELNEFERQFGGYIDLVSNKNRDELQQRQKWMFERMIGNDESFRAISSVDTFNYSAIHNDNLQRKTRHLHGDVSHPIFGIDKNNDERSPESGMVVESEIFTKTSRKLMQQMYVNLINMDDNFENVIIFGHSLNRQDYSYFYPLFDRIELSNPLKNSKCVILYNLYDKSAQKEIETRLFNAIHDLFVAYDVEHLGHVDGRLIDYLVTQNRIIIYDIDSLSCADWAKSLREKAKNQGRR